MIIEQVNIAEIRPCPINAKKHDGAQISNVAQSIKEFGFVQPLVLTDDNEVIIGHCRLLAAKKLKMQTVPVVYARNLTPEQVTKLRNLDNKLNESEWDMDFLKEQIPELDFSDYEGLDWGIEDDTILQPIEKEETPFDDIEKIESHYGVPYQGNKSRIADIIISILPKGERLVDLFGGGGRNHALCIAFREME